ncbi:MAG: hypothetical protein WDW36_009356 [Sanguina aurantia]
MLCTEPEGLVRTDQHRVTDPTVQQRCASRCQPLLLAVHQARYGHALCTALYGVLLELLHWALASGERAEQNTREVEKAMWSATILLESFSERGWVMGLRQADRVEAVLQLVLEELQPLVQAAGLKSLDIASDPKVRSSLAQIRDLHALVTSPPGCSSLAGVVGSAALQHSFLSALLPLLDSADMEGLVANLHEEMTVAAADLCPGPHRAIRHPDLRLFWWLHLRGVEEAAWPGLWQALLPHLGRPHAWSRQMGDAGRIAQVLGQPGARESIQAAVHCMGYATHTCTAELDMAFQPHLSLLSTLQSLAQRPPVVLPRNSKGFLCSTCTPPVPAPPSGLTSEVSATAAPSPAAGPLPRLRLLLVCGASGSGKSCTAGALAQRSVGTGGWSSVCFADLRGAASFEACALAAGIALGVPHHTCSRLPSQRLTAWVERHGLQMGRLGLVLDNVDAVLGAGGTGASSGPVSVRAAASADPAAAASAATPASALCSLLQQLLSQVPGLQIILTSSATAPEQLMDGLPEGTVLHRMLPLSPSCARDLLASHAQQPLPSPGQAELLLLQVCCGLPALLRLAGCCLSSGTVSATQMAQLAGECLQRPQSASRFHTALLRQSLTSLPPQQRALLASAATSGPALPDSGIALLSGHAMHGCELRVALCRLYDRGLLRFLDLGKRHEIDPLLRSLLQSHPVAVSARPGAPALFPDLPPLLALCATALSELEHLHSCGAVTSCLRIHDMHHHLLDPVLQLAACALPPHAHDSRAAACVGLYVDLLVQHLNGICRQVWLPDGFVKAAKALALLAVTLTQPSDSAAALLVASRALLHAGLLPAAMECADNARQCLVDSGLARVGSRPVATAHLQVCWDDASRDTGPAKHGTASHDGRDSRLDILTAAGHGVSEALVGQLYLARSEIAAARSQWDQAIQYGRLHLASLEGSEGAGSQGLFLAQAALGHLYLRQRLLSSALPMCDAAVRGLMTVTPKATVRLLVRTRLMLAEAKLEMGADPGDVTELAHNSLSLLQQSQGCFNLDVADAQLLLSRCTSHTRSQASVHHALRALHILLEILGDGCPQVIAAVLQLADAARRLDPSPATASISRALLAHAAAMTAAAADPTARAAGDAGDAGEQAAARSSGPQPASRGTDGGGCHGSSSTDALVRRLFSQLDWSVHPDHCDSQLRGSHSHPPHPTAPGTTSEQRPRMQQQGATHGPDPADCAQSHLSPPHTSSLPGAPGSPATPPSPAPNTSQHSRSWGPDTHAHPPAQPTLHRAADGSTSHADPAVRLPPHVAGASNSSSAEPGHVGKTRSGMGAAASAAMATGHPAPGPSTSAHGARPAQTSPPLATLNPSSSQQHTETGSYTHTHRPQQQQLRCSTPPVSDDPSTVVASQQQRGTPFASDNPTTVVSTQQQEQQQRLTHSGPWTETPPLPHTQSQPLDIHPPHRNLNSLTRTASCLQPSPPSHSPPAAATASPRTLQPATPPQTGAPPRPPLRLHPGPIRLFEIPPRRFEFLPRPAARQRRVPGRAVATGGRAWRQVMSRLGGGRRRCASGGSEYVRSETRMNPVFRTSGATGATDLGSPAESADVRAGGTLRHLDSLTPSGGGGGAGGGESAPLVHCLRSSSLGPSGTAVLQNPVFDDGTVW